MNDERRFPTQVRESRQAWRPNNESPHVAKAHPVPYWLLRVRYVEQDGKTYIVQPLDADADVAVAKRRRGAEQYPPPHDQRPRGVRLMRWSHVALLAAVFGGVGGVFLGVIVLLAALIHLVGLRLRVRRWLQSTSGEAASLPASASSERFRVLAALGEGLVACLLGALVTLLLARYIL
ncbi:MAG TPA: hypothetical protein VMV29_10455 [Ktedonobacterales bacterium]|nr:hypothetical protein [Ktedonobacterales bacterium]